MCTLTIGIENNGEIRVLAALNLKGFVAEKGLKTRQLLTEVDLKEYAKKIATYLGTITGENVEVFDRQDVPDTVYSF